MPTSLASCQLCGVACVSRTSLYKSRSLRGVDQPIVLVADISLGALGFKKRYHSSLRCVLRVPFDASRRMCGERRAGANTILKRYQNGRRTSSDWPMRWMRWMQMMQPTSLYEKS